VHVAYIHQHFSTRSGETGTRSYEMSRRLLAAGHRVTMICGASERARHPTRGGGRVTEFDADGIRVLCVNEPYANRMGFVRRVLAFLRFARAARQLVAGLDADLVFATSTPLTVGLPGMKGARRLGVPFVFEVRDLWPELPIAMGIIRDPIMKAYTRRLERRIYFAAERIIALAPGIRDGICKTGYPSERVTLVPNAADLDLFGPQAGAPLDARFGAPGDFRLVFTGAHGRANGLDAVLDATVELRRRQVTGVRFVMIGAGGEKARLMQRSREQRLEGYFAWIDPVSKNELAGLLAAMDVGMMILKNVPAFYYGTSPNKFFDYIASGLPVLNNYPGWLAELIGANRCGLAVPPDDATAFADAVLALRGDRDELRQMGARARALAEREFSRDLLGQRFVAALEHAAAAGRQRAPSSTTAIATPDGVRATHP
jgi:glycosyltransferase involved in cell wall biosynthesis